MKLLGKRKFLIGGVIIVVAIGSLSFMALKGAATYYYSVGDALGKATTLQNQTIRVSGEVAPGSLEQATSGQTTTKFVLVDTTNTTVQLPIIYKGSPPDAFKEGNDAVVEGSLSSTGVFEARQIIVKCPSKYVPKQ